MTWAFITGAGVFATGVLFGFAISQTAINSILKKD